MGCGAALSAIEHLWRNEVGPELRIGVGTEFDHGSPGILAVDGLVILVGVEGPNLAQLLSAGFGDSACLLCDVLDREAEVEDPVAFVLEVGVRWLVLRGIELKQFDTDAVCGD